MPKGSATDYIKGLSVHSTYSAPRFEDKTRSAVVREADRAFERSQDLRKELNKALHTVALWNELLSELEKAKVEKVGQLPKDRAEHWKILLEVKYYTT